MASTPTGVTSVPPCLTVGRVHRRYAVVISPAAMASRVRARNSTGGPRQRVIRSTATQWHAAASTTNVWKISWKPNSAGHGFGRLAA